MAAPVAPLARLVPASVRTRLGGREAIILGSGLALEAARRHRALTLVLRVADPRLVPVLLRAARVHDAVVGLTPADGTRRARERFFEVVADAADATGHGRPFFLAAPPVALGPEAEALIHDRIEAGYTHLVLEPDGASASPDVWAQASGPARERGLGVELRLGAGQEEAGRRLLEFLDGRGDGPDVVVAPWGRRHRSDAAWGWVGEGGVAGVREAREATAAWACLPSPPSGATTIDDHAEARVYHVAAELIRESGLCGTARALLTQAGEG